MPPSRFTLAKSRNMFCRLQSRYRNSAPGCCFKGNPYENLDSTCGLWAEVLYKMVMRLSPGPCRQESISADLFTQTVPGLVPGPPSFRRHPAGIGKCVGQTGPSLEGGGEYSIPPGSETPSPAGRSGLRLCPEHTRVLLSWLQEFFSLPSE